MYLSTSVVTALPAVAFGIVEIYRLVFSFRMVYTFPPIGVMPHCREDTRRNVNKRGGKASKSEETDLEDRTLVISVDRQAGAGGLGLGLQSHREAGVGDLVGACAE